MHGTCITARRYAVSRNSKRFSIDYITHRPSSACCMTPKLEMLEEEQASVRRSLGLALCTVSQRAGIPVCVTLSQTHMLQELPQPITNLS